MRFSVSCQHLPSAVRAFTSFLAEINSPTYDIAIRECDLQRRKTLPLQTPAGFLQSAELKAFDF